MIVTDTNQPRLHALDGVRGIAASLVVLLHLGAANAARRLAENGHAIAASLLQGMTAGGVELFFVLSGVVLARPYLRANRSMDALKYLRRRVTRLFPPFFVAWLVAGLSVYLATGFPTWWTQSEHLPTFNARDWFEQLGIVYWGDKLYNNAWWSLSTEVVFYLVFPFLIPLFRLAPRSRFLVWLLFVTSISLSVIAYMYPVFELAVFNRVIVYASCFCAGMLMAAVDFPKWLRLILACTGLAWVLCSAHVEALNPHVGWGLLGFALVSSASEPNTLAERVLCKPIFIWLGERSYSIFLTHYAVIVLVFHGISEITSSKGLGYFLATRFFGILLMLLAAMLLFHFVERRFAKNLVTAGAFWPWDAARSSRESDAFTSARVQSQVP